MTLHKLLPLIAFLLNLSLAGIALLRNPGSPLNRIFVYFVSGMALWNLGVFALRRAPDETSAYLLEVVIHAGVIAIPVFFYHFVLTFLDGVPPHRRSLVSAYALAILFTGINMSGSPLFMKGVQQTYWGWAPAPGPLYFAFLLLYFNAFMIWGLCHLVRAQRSIGSSFRRNRVALVMIGTGVSLAGAFVDFLRFILTRFVPAADQLYPVGIPANMLFALLLGTSIVRYRLFDVNAAVKRVAIYLVLGSAITGTLALATRAVERHYDVQEATAIWLAVPLALIITLLLTPLGQVPEDLIQRLMFEKRRGCYDTLLDLSARMSAILEFRRLIDTLAQGLVHGIPLTHCVVMIYDRAAHAFVAAHEETIEPRDGVPAIRADGRIVEWLRRADGALVTEEVKLNPTMAAYFGSADADLEGIRASVIVPLKAEADLIGILLLGEKLSGEIFDAQELEVLRVLANQAAVAIQNARLFEETGRRQREAETLAEVGRLISQSLDPEEVAQRIAESLRVLLDARVSSLFRVDPKSGELVVLARAGEPLSTPGRGTDVAPGVGMVALAVRERGPVVTSDLLREPRVTLTPEERARLEPSPYRAALVVPLTVKDTVIGALGVGDREGRLFDEDAIRLAQTFAAQAALALENTRLYEEVRGARDFLQSIAENSADAILTTDVHGRITYVSPGAEDIFGYGAAELLGRPVADFYKFGLHEARAVMQRLRTQGRIRSHETAFRAKDGRWVDVNTSVSLLRDADGAVVGTLGIVKDVTERKRLEEHLRQSQKMEAVGRLAGGVAHDFNNLLQVITGRSHLTSARLDPGDPIQIELDLIHKAAMQAATLTRQLLAFSRKQVIAPRALDLNAVLSGIEPMLRRLIGEDIDLVIAPAPGLDRVKADPGQLEQVILNLAVNARDAMPRGGRLLLETANAELDEAAVGRWPESRPGRYVMLAVGDTGVGMDAETQAHIFEPFFTTKDPGTGTGLGLATVYGIVQQHGGAIGVESALGRGTTFRIYLPRAPEATAAPDRSPASRGSARGAETVLLVEDDVDVRVLTRMILREQGYKVLEAASSGEGLRIGEQHPDPIDLLVTDVVMPHLSGRDLADRLASVRPEMKVLYMSGYTDDAIARHGVLDPGTAFLQKPFTPDIFARKVREVLDAPRSRGTPSP